MAGAQAGGRALERALALARVELAGLPARDVDLFAARLARWWDDLRSGLAAVYDPGPALLDPLVTRLARRYRERPEALKLLDLSRMLRPDWFQDPSMIGYVCYVDRFAGTLRGVLDRLDHLSALGVRYLHLMPLLAPRPGESDGGYAVADYRAVDPALGTMDDLDKLAAGLRDRGISLCVDLVLNHCAAEHEWARRARAGDPEYERMFLVFDDPALPAAYERSLPEVFPDFAPGNFTYLPDRHRWVWTTFHEYQWDLNWANPRVFVEMADVLLTLANRGVEVLRLDAVAFMWKRLGTDCQNQPEVHDLLQALRACARIVAPAVVFKAEAIVPPDRLVAYLGLGRHAGKVSDLAYHNTLMVQVWSALATRDARLATHVLDGLPRKPAETAWATYVRNHDDVGWAITPADAAAVGWDDAAHRAFLADFYSGSFPGSFAWGADFQANPATGDRRTSGMTASLAGLDRAEADGDPGLVDLAVRRILLAYAVVFGFDGIPLVYMGDEVGLRNDGGFAADPDHAGDNRWLHRPRMDWAAVARAARPGTVEARIWDGLRHLGATRAAIPQLCARAPLDVLDVGQPRVLAFVRRHALGPLLALHNVTEDTQWVDPEVAAAVGLRSPVDRLGGDEPVRGDLRLDPYQARWLVDPDR